MELESPDYYDSLASNYICSGLKLAPNETCLTYDQFVENYQNPAGLWIQSYNCDSNNMVGGSNDELIRQSSAENKQIKDAIDMGNYEIIQYL